MKYIATTRTVDKPTYVEPKQLTKEEFEMAMLFSPINTTLNLPNYISFVISEDTFKFISSVANIDYPTYGDKVYTINGLEFRIETEEDYIKMYGEIPQKEN